MKRNFTMLFFLFFFSSSVWIQLSLFYLKDEWGDSATYGRLMHLTAPHFYRFSILMRENDVYLILPRFTSFYLDFSFSVLSVLDLSVYTTIIIYILNWSFCTTDIYLYSQNDKFSKLSHLGTGLPWHWVAWALGRLSTALPRQWVVFNELTWGRRDRLYGGRAWLWCNDFNSHFVLPATPKGSACTSLGPNHNK